MEEAARFIKKALGCGLNFYVYSMPGKDTVNCGASDTLYPGLERKGFVTASFDNKRVFTIPEDIACASSIPGASAASCPEYGESPAPTLKESHAAEIADIKRKLSAAGGGKIVAARRFIVDSGIDVAASFEALRKAYPFAFIFCFRTTDSGLWLGATPETLLRGDGDRLSTMALAGTRPRSDLRDNGSPISFAAPGWDRKNIEEQQLVVDFICEKLKKHGLQPEASWRFTRTAGPVEHLCSRITASRRDNHVCGTLPAIIKDLSPTPALCGSDRNISLKLIRRHEGDRGYYGGFIGPWQSESDFHLFVNLRSCRIYEHKACLYAGGGITLLSDADDEWTETDRKLSTLLTRLVRR